MFVSTTAPKLAKRALAVSMLLAAMSAQAGIIWGAVANASANASDLSTGWHDELIENALDADGGNGANSAYAVAATTGSMSWAKADMASATLHVWGSSPKPTKLNPDGWGGAVSDASASASIVDVLHFDVPLERLGALVPWSIDIDGSLTGSKPDQARAAVEYRWNDFDDNHSVWRTNANFGSGFTVSDSFVLHPGENAIPIFVRLSGNSYSGSGDGLGDASFNLAHTLHFRVTVPEGVRASSASGLFPFIQAPAPAVPEPTAPALLAGGVLVLGLSRRTHGVARSIRAQWPDTHSC